jgi:hypothetical protein
MRPNVYTPLFGPYDPNIHTWMEYMDHLKVGLLVSMFAITEISSAILHANGYKNTAMPTTISSPASPKFISKGKNYTIMQKLTCANSLK